MGSWEKEKSCHYKVIGIFLIVYWVGSLFENWKVALIIFPGLYLVGLILFVLLPKGFFLIKRYSKQCKHGKWGGETLNNCKICESQKIDSEKQKEFFKKTFELLRKMNAESKKKEEDIKTSFHSLRVSEKTRINNLYKLNFENIINVNPYEFEYLIAKLYIEFGYSVKQTNRSNDGGRDLILRKDSELIIVECKRYNINQKIGRPIIQKFHSAVITDKANKGILVTTSYFTENVYLYPSVKNGLIELVDRDKLRALLLEKFGIYNPVSFQDVCLSCGLEYEHEFSKINYCNKGHKGDYITLDDFLNIKIEK